MKCEHKLINSNFKLLSIFQTCQLTPEIMNITATLLEGITFAVHLYVCVCVKDTYFHTHSC